MGRAEHRPVDPPGESARGNPLAKVGLRLGGWPMEPPPSSDKLDGIKAMGPGARCEGSWADGERWKNRERQAEGVEWTA